MIFHALTSFWLQNKYIILFQFNHFDTETDLDIVELWNGGSTIATSQLITRLSGSTLGQFATYLSSTNWLVVRFITDGSVEKSGFNFTWSTGTTILFCNFLCQYRKYLRELNFREYLLICCLVNSRFSLIISISHKDYTNVKNKIHEIKVMWKFPNLQYINFKFWFREIINLCQWFVILNLL